ncbi:peptidoglycan-binding protein [Nonomuraea indica]|uniref:peptidoglycan-binding protein n=1 Tax=Nonomuraea indica TaxID=1581193 RepID=UPI000C7A6604|nr:peptidoglycan-binding protein [Nonomuraea indica]
MGRPTLGDPPAAGTEPPLPRPRRRRGRKAAVLLTAVALTGVAAVTVTGTGLLEGGGAAPATAALPPATARISRQTLDDTRDVDGELGYGPATTAVSRKPGTITWLPAGGARVTRGRSLYRVDNDPVVLMYGSTPAYRDLRIGVEGRDVESLERNLRKLGYDGFTVDDTYSAATAEAVMDWQDDRGLDQTGVVELGRVVFADGAVRVETLEAQAGQPTAPGRPVLSYTGTEKVVTVRLDAEDQRMAAKGAKVTVTLPDGGRSSGRVTEVATVIEPGDGPDAEPLTRLEALVALTGGKAARAAVARFDQAAVDVTFTAARREDVLTVPVAALVALREGGFGVEVVEGGSTRYVPVETGLFAGGRVEISGAGLAAGMTVGVPR